MINLEWGPPERLVFAHPPNESKGREGEAQGSSLSPSCGIKIMRDSHGEQLSLWLMGSIRVTCLPPTHEGGKTEGN